MASQVNAGCRQALVLALDVSGSVDAREYALQLGGLANALNAPEVREKLLASPEAPVNLAVFEWSHAGYQRKVLGWTAVTSEAVLAQITAQLRQSQRQSFKGSTALGVALDHAQRLIATGPDCWVRTIDVSGDGTSNEGIPPEDLHRRESFRTITINGLVITPGPEIGRSERHMETLELSAYFRRRVIHGPGAFIEVANGFEDYERAMRRKLERELEDFVVGSLR